MQKDIRTKSGRRRWRMAFCISCPNLCSHQTDARNSEPITSKTLELMTPGQAACSLTVLLGEQGWLLQCFHSHRQPPTALGFPHLTTTVGCGDHLLAPGVHLASFHRAGTVIFTECDCDCTIWLIKPCTDSIPDRVWHPDNLTSCTLCLWPQLQLYSLITLLLDPLAYQPWGPSSSGSYFTRHLPQGCCTCCISRLGCSSHRWAPAHHDFLVETSTTWSPEPFLHSTHRSCHVTVTVIWLMSICLHYVSSLRAGTASVLLTILLPALTTLLWLWRHSIRICQRKDRWKGGRVERRLPRPVPNFRQALGDYTAFLSYSPPHIPSLPSIGTEITYSVYDPVSMRAVFHTDGTSPDHRSILSREVRGQSWVFASF